MQMPWNHPPEAVGNGGISGIRIHLRMPDLSGRLASTSGAQGLAGGPAQTGVTPVRPT
jgi:hypothetical protein